MTAAVPPTHRRPGGRSARIQDAVFAETLSLLEQTSVSALSVKLIATRAGVAETTIYRRWGSLPGVIAGALSQLAVSENPIPDTGSLPDDLRALLGNVVAIIERPAVRRIFRFAMSLDDADSDAADARNAFWQSRFSTGAAIVLRAIERKEIPPLDDAQAVIETLVGAAYIRAFLLERPMTDTVIDDSVRAAMLVAHGEQRGRSEGMPASSPQS